MPGWNQLLSASSAQTSSQSAFLVHDSVLHVLHVLHMLYLRYWCVCVCAVEAQIVVSVAVVVQRLEAALCLTRNSLHSRSFA